MKVTHNQPQNQTLIIAFEGIRGAGKSTQVRALLEKLTTEGIPFVSSEWNSDSVISEFIRELKRNRDLSSIDHCLLHAADFYRRYEKVIKPSSPPVVVFDRYVHTSFARDTFRGISKDFLTALYEGVRAPNVIIYIDASPELTLERKKGGVDNFFFYGNGQDYYPNLEPREAFLLYQRHQANIYNEMFENQSNTLRVDAKNSPESLANEIWRNLCDKLKPFKLNTSKPAKD